jgi:hypothetical protein
VMKAITASVIVILKVMCRPDIGNLSGLERN